MNRSVLRRSSGSSPRDFASNMGLESASSSPAQQSLRPGGSLPSYMQHQQKKVRCCGLCRRRFAVLACLATLLMVCTPFILLWALNDDQADRLWPSRGRVSFAYDAFNCEDVSNMDERVMDLRRIRDSVRGELLQLEERRGALKREITQLNEYLGKEIPRRRSELTNLENSIHESKLVLKELQESNTPEIRLPNQPLFPPGDHQMNAYHGAENGAKSAHRCNINNCVDFRRCSITAPFSIFVYPLRPGASSLAKLYRTELLSSLYTTTRPDRACIFVALTDQIMPPPIDPSTFYEFWNGDGSNHLLIRLPHSSAQSGSSNNHHSNNNYNITFGSALIASDNFAASKFRQQFDIFIPLQLPKYDPNQWLLYPPLLPYSRRFLLSYWYASSPVLTDNRIAATRLLTDLEKMKGAAVKTKDEFEFRSCARTADLPTTVADLSALCGSSSERAGLLGDSMFSLLPLLDDNHIHSCTFLVRLIESFTNGAVPVIIGGELSIALPISDLIDWRKVVIHLPFARLPEMHFILRSIVAEDLLEMRRLGRQLVQERFGNVRAVVGTILSAVRHRFGMLAPPLREFLGKPVFNDSFSPVNSEALAPSSAETDEYLGPLEARYPSPSYRHNFSSLLSYSYDSWNGFYSGLAQYALPYRPFNHPNLPTETRMLADTRGGFRPINNGFGGSGKEFSEAIGGNVHKEQFTVVMLTYARDVILQAALQRLNKLPYLNKVVVVWNNVDRDPDASIVWPSLHVPVEFVNPGRNSLNNRFLPFEQIETEAVLSVDDDVLLFHHEIVFAFRVWREQRDKVVGFPGRFHSWDNGWLYNSNHSCELSMVLTGAAFFHKFYMYAYSYVMPEAIRWKVDELMNCEDLAFNFLVSHMTRQPPVKTTSRWTFKCPGCPDTLSTDESHFLERHDCLKFFSRVYGYNPLLYTQFRVDSVLFKTKVPHNHQKCFRYV